MQLANPFPANAILRENDRTTTASTTTGATLQAPNTDQLFGHDNHSSSAAASTTASPIFSASRACTIGSNYVVSGPGIFLGQSGSPVSDGPVGLRTTNQYTGIYALDTFNVTKDLANYRRRPVQCRQHPAARPIDTTSLNGNDGGAAFADARSGSPARPRAFCAGMKATF
jgi:hypothetical protein